jgi:hypothetical protein
MIRQSDYLSYSFSKEEIAQAEQYARKMGKRKEERGKYDDTQTTFQVNRNGKLGEIAFAAYLNMRGQVDFRVYAGNDGGVDFKKHGYTIQVKTNSGGYATHYLYFNDVSLFKTDFAVLVIMRSQTSVQIAGWIPKDLFQRIADRKLNFGKGSRIGVAEYDLRPMSELKQFLDGLDDLKQREHDRNMVKKGL